MTKPNVVFIHGSGATVDSIWFPELKAELEMDGIEIVAQTMPDRIRARSFLWLPFMQDVLGVDEDCIVVGHSSGALAAMRYAESHQVFGSILVGAYHTDLNIRSERMSGYFDGPWNWEAMKANQNWIVQFASPDDPYIPVDEPRYISSQLESDYYEIANRGHYLQRSFPELITVIRDKIESQ